jgi:hypothetical protein
MKGFMGPGAKIFPFAASSSTIKKRAKALCNTYLNAD